MLTRLGQVWPVVQASRHVHGRPISRPTRELLGVV